MLNMITITSIEATNLETENDSYNDVQKTPDINYIRDSSLGDQKRENIQSIPNTSKSNNKLSYFSIKSRRQEYFHPFSEVGEWQDFDLTRYFINQLDDDTYEYLYCYDNNQIYNKPFVGISRGEYQSPTINMIVDNKLKVQVFVNDPITHNFYSEYVAFSNSILFFNLLGYEQEMFVSSIVLFFKYHNKIYCSIRQIKPGSTIEWFEGMIEQRWKDFIEACVLRNLSETPENLVKQVEMILQDEEYVKKLLNLEDAAHYNEDCYTSINEEGNENSRPHFFVNEYDAYNKKYWKPGDSEICKSTDYFCNLYSVNDRMITKYEFCSFENGNKMPLLWRITTHNIVNTLEIINSEFDKYLFSRCICERVFTIPDNSMKQGTKFKKIEYVFFRCADAKKALFCVKFVDDVFQSVKDCDIHRIHFILRTTDVFYTLTHTRVFVKLPF